MTKMTLVGKPSNVLGFLISLCEAYGNMNILDILEDWKLAQEDGNNE